MWRGGHRPPFGLRLPSVFAGAHGGGGRAQRDRDGEWDVGMYGKIHEKDAVELYKQKNPERMVIEECGLFVHKTCGFVGASPDALVDNDGIPEVKCPFSARDMNFDEAHNSKTFCLDKTTGKLQRTHKYYYQIQGQLEYLPNKQINSYKYVFEDLVKQCEKVGVQLKPDFVLADFEVGIHTAAKS
ncbi:hypothetical protein GE061_000030 [Apolygus lucorum]|uniref:YqaJ viral recombinase domain-containing protein n=1 Tax=Apolygus lucorum TaxID=248454 RepID=A0A8S9Y4M3_APOLU|nr:hypothetical protein GE061_000030 [Apolygus lucorum]